MCPEMMNIIPDPRILVALTRNPLRPLDALCELIDNAIDSFRVGEQQGYPEAHPLVEIRVPGEAEVKRGEGLVRVKDNGPGLDKSSLGDAIRAGYSGNRNRYDTLGLFGMGFNIATGKLGRHTVVTTARRDDAFARRVTIDLPHITRSARFEVPLEEIAKPPGLEHGTMVEIRQWWPDGDPNAGFANQLARIPKDTLREQIGRRYATLLRPSATTRVRIIANDTAVTPFEHCVWGDHRFVERHSWGTIPAKIVLNETLYSVTRCLIDGSIIDAVTPSCPECGGTDFRTVHETITGWVGIQRFDDNDFFGIDLIRKGRAIRIAEKDAFFNYVDDFGNSSREYPIDQQSGRIVGEIHLDHVPVDYQKQDFQRSSEEWQRAISALRGGSFIPKRWPNNERNESPLSRLFQGYRKVRTFGRADMYMGVFDTASGKATRAPRETEKAFYARFLNKESGYYDDAKWWELVETATIPPLPSHEECNSCGFQNRPEDETCGNCNTILKGKPCASCAHQIVLSATLCPQCGASQVPEVDEPWRCDVCQTTNAVQDDQCATCGSLRGTEHPCNPEVLRRQSQPLLELSFMGRTFPLIDGRSSEPLDVHALRSPQLRPTWNGPTVPVIALRGVGSIELFIDLQHAFFTTWGCRPEDAVAIEAAYYLYSANTALAGKPGHSVGSLASQVLSAVWGDKLSVGPETVREDIRRLFTRICELLQPSPAATDFYAELSGPEQSALATHLISVGLLDQLSDLVRSGAYIRHADPALMGRYFTYAPQEWLNVVFEAHLPSADTVGAEAAANIATQVNRTFRSCLEDCAAFLTYRQADSFTTTRARAALEYLAERLN